MTDEAIIRAALDRVMEGYLLRNGVAVATTRRADALAALDRLTATLSEPEEPVSEGEARAGTPVSPGSAHSSGSLSVTQAERIYQDAARYLLDTGWIRDGEDLGLWASRGASAWRHGWFTIGDALIVQWERDGVSMLSAVEATASDAPVPGWLEAANELAAPFAAWALHWEKMQRAVDRVVGVSGAPVPGASGTALTPLVLAEVRDERERQERKGAEHRARGQEHWRSCADPLLPTERKLAILGEEYGEVAKALNEEWIGQPANLREELIHTAAVAVAWAESLAVGVSGGTPPPSEPRLSDDPQVVSAHNRLPHTHFPGCGCVPPATADWFDGVVARSVSVGGGFMRLMLADWNGVCDGWRMGERLLSAAVARAETAERERERDEALRWHDEWRARAAAQFKRRSDAEDAVGRLEEALRAIAGHTVYLPGEPRRDAPLVGTYDPSEESCDWTCARDLVGIARAALVGGTPPPGEGDAGGRGFPASSGAAPTQTTEEKR